MPKKKRSRSRRSPKVRTRTVTKFRTRKVYVKAKRRGRRGGGGGGGLPFRTSGSALSRVQGSAVPVLKMALPIVGGAAIAAALAKRYGAKLGNDQTKVGGAITVVMLLLGSMASRFRSVPILGARGVQLAALGGVVDGALRLSAKLRQAGRIPGLPAGSSERAGLLAGVASPGEEERRRAYDPIALTILQD